MKKAMFVMLVVVAVFYYKGHDLKKLILPYFESFSEANRDTVVVEFTDGEDLLAQLRKVETGRKIEVRQKTDGTQVVSTGIS